jgi:cystathionine beta-synthase
LILPRVTTAWQTGASEIEGAWRAEQFTNPANPQTHYGQMGPEIWELTEGHFMVFVAAGTGGTISGVGKFPKEKNAKIRVIGADIEGSVLSGGTPGSWKVEGIGEDLCSEYIERASHR